MIDVQQICSGINGYNVLLRADICCIRNYLKISNNYDF